MSEPAFRGEKHYLILAIDHDRCGEFIPRYDNAATKSFVNILKSYKAKVVVCSYSNRQTYAINELLSKKRAFFATFGKHSKLFE